MIFCLLPFAEASAVEWGAPENLTWHKKVVSSSSGYKLQNDDSCIAWKAAAPLPSSDVTWFEINLYRDGVLHFNHRAGYNTKQLRSGNYVYFDLSAPVDWESGTYSFTVQTIGENRESSGQCSAVSESGTWAYTLPTNKVSKPTNLRWDFPVARWTAPKNASVTYDAVWYYSPTKDGEPEQFHRQWNLGSTRNTPPDFVLENGLCGPGYYSFKVRSVPTNMTSYRSSDWVGSEIYYVKMDKPTVKASVVSSSGKPKLSWKKVDFAEEYHVYRAASEKGTYSLLKTVTGTSFTDSDATAGKAYYYKVRAVSGNGVKSSYTSPARITCDLARPEVSVQNVESTGKIKLTWNKISGAKKYLVYRRTGSKGDYTELGYTTSASYTDKTAKAGKLYYYRVKAIAGSSSANSAKSASVKRTCDLARPEVTIKLSKGDPKLSWKAVSGAEKYYVYRAASDSDDYSKIKTVKGTSFTDTSAKAGKMYYYKVRAVHDNSSANSAKSPVVFVKAK